MSLLSEFLGTDEFSLYDSPMFCKLIENIDSVDDKGFEYDIAKFSDVKNYASEKVGFSKSSSYNISMRKYNSKSDEKYHYSEKSYIKYINSKCKEVAA